MKQRARNPAALIQGPFCPLISPSQIERRLATGKFRMTGHGLEKRCARCERGGFDQIYWPIDTEFWFTSTTNADGVHTWCRACFCEYRWPERYGLAPAKAAA